MVCHCVTDDNGQFGATLSPSETCLLWGPGIAVPVKVSSSFIGQRQTGPLQFALD